MHTNQFKSNSFQNLLEPILFRTTTKLRIHNESLPLHHLGLFKRIMFLIITMMCISIFYNILPLIKWQKLLTIKSSNFLFIEQPLS